MSPPTFKNFKLGSMDMISWSTTFLRFRRSTQSAWAMLSGTSTFVLLTDTFGYGAACSGVSPRRCSAVILKSKSLNQPYRLKNSRFRWVGLYPLQSLYGFWDTGSMRSPSICMIRNLSQKSLISSGRVIIWILFFTFNALLTVAPSLSGRMFWSLSTAASVKHCKDDNTYTQ